MAFGRLRAGPGEGLGSALPPQVALWERKEWRRGAEGEIS